jgi:hypothetical protein
MNTQNLFLNEGAYVAFFLFSMTVARARTSKGFVLNTKNQPIKAL